MTTPAPQKPSKKAELLHHARKKGHAALHHFSRHALGGTKTMTGLAGWMMLGFGMGFFGYQVWKFREQMKPVEILPANEITGVTRKIDHAAHESEDRILDVADRFRKMRGDYQNDSIFTAFARRLDTLDLKTVAQKAFAVDSIVDASIKPADDHKLYGGTYWATPVETLLRRRADAKGSAILKDALLDYLSVDARQKYIHIADKQPNAHAENVSVMIDTAAAGKAESLVLLKNDGQAAFVVQDSLRDAYQIAVNKKGIRYINPSQIAPAKPPAAAARAHKPKPRS